MKKLYIFGIYSKSYGTNNKTCHDIETTGEDTDTCSVAIIFLMMTVCQYSITYIAVLVPE